MVNIEIDDLAKIVQHGMRGEGASVALLARRLASKLKKTDPKAAERLASVLANDTVTRDRSLPSLPVDAESRQRLHQEYLEPVLEVEPQWSPKVAVELAKIVRERQQAVDLRVAGLEPIHSALFKGPPGVGKTLAAKWLARELGLPLLLLDLASVMSSLLGKTGSNLKAVIDYAKGFPCVLLLDEFDAIAKKRDDDRDVGELKRLVNVLLQAIDEWPSHSLLVAATNHPDMLDPAVWRRFDMAVSFDLPPEATIRALLAETDLSKKLAQGLAELLKGQSFATIRKLVTSARKTALLDQIPVESALIQSCMALIVGTKIHPNLDRDLNIINKHLHGATQRTIAEDLGITHPTVGRVLQKYLQKE